MALLQADAGALCDYLAEMCDRIDQIDPRLRAFLPEPDRRARVMAAGQAADGPLHGIPVGIKDIIHVDGFPTHAGSDVPADEITGPQASIVSRLLEAGVVIAGKTVTAEFAVTAPGPTVNPHHVGHTPGGSSSGSAAAVAAGLVPLALGTQTIGSVVRPAAYCGVVGFRTTHGRVALDGVIPNASSLDSIGWFTAGVADAALAARSICSDWQPVGPAGRLPVLGIPASAYLDHATEPALQAFWRQVDILRDAGFLVRRGAFLEDFQKVGETLFVINRWELARTHAAWFSRYADRYRPETATAIEQGQQIEETDYRAAARWQRDFARAYTEVTAATEVDVWIAPAATETAPKSLASTGDPTMSSPFSLAGAPAVSIPAGLDTNGLPWGLQCAGGLGADEHLLAAGAAIEVALVAPKDA